MTDREVIDEIKWFMHEHSHNKEVCDYLINILEEREKKKQREIEKIAEVIEMGNCYFGADPAYFGLPDAHNIELAQARVLYEAGYRKVE